MDGRFEIKQADRQFYEKNLKEFLPYDMIDFHTHIWLDSFRNCTKSVNVRYQTWPSRVASENPVEGLMDTYSMLFPDKHVTPLIFGNPENGICIESSNRYVEHCSVDLSLPSLMLARPEWDGDELGKKLQAGGFLGIKVYLSYAPLSIPADEIRISDFLPRHQLEVINNSGGIVMLHIPGSKRIKDPLNLKEIIGINDEYPDLKLVIAHVGRAYCREDLGDAMDILSKAGAENLYFDISANTNQWVFRKAIEYFGADKLLFGSDLPITRMRCRRVCENGTYINIVPKGLYGDLSNEPHMREEENGGSDRITFFIYEEIDAFRKAAKAAGLSANEIKDVFYGNAARLIGGTKKEDK